MAFLIGLRRGMLLGWLIAIAFIAGIALGACIR